MDERGSIDWDFVLKSCGEGRLLDVLAKIPQEHWGDVDGLGSTLLHYASFSPKFKSSKSIDQKQDDRHQRTHIWRFYPCYRCFNESKTGFTSNFVNFWRKCHGFCMAVFYSSILLLKSRDYCR